MIAGYIMRVYFNRSCGTGRDSRLLDLEELALLEAVICPGLLAAELIQAAIEKYQEKIQIDDAIVSDNTIWLEGTNKRSSKHVMIPVI